MDQSKDLLIDAGRWHVDAEATEYKERALLHFSDCYTTLLDFLRSNDLLADPSFGLEVRDWYKFEFRESNLTQEGIALVKQCHGTWNPAFGQGRTQRHLVQWKKKLAVLRT